MACHCAYYVLPPSPLRKNFYKTTTLLSSKRPNSLLLSAISNNRDSYNTLVSEAVSLLGPATFVASKLKLKGWYSKDDVVAEWKRVNGEMCLHIHCYVSGPNLMLDLAAEFRYHIFSKEMPWYSKLCYMETLYFSESILTIGCHGSGYFHSNLKKYNRIECWGPLKDAVEGRQGDNTKGITAHMDSSHPGDKRERQNPYFKFYLHCFFDSLKLLRIMISNFFNTFEAHQLQQPTPEAMNESAFMCKVQIILWEDAKREENQVDVKQGLLGAHKTDS
ncbi:unnamed protein product [Prunus armeniaca]|uniref:Staygreen protein domain-containing protein n=1 Tax=Prunus armeniaca TaxID=36596 RepID=A0A6J5Y1Y4_PRUAR|nr:unnamed protein product [Prunus armeniaca]